MPETNEVNNESTSDEPVSGDPKTNEATNNELRHEAIMEQQEAELRAAIAAANLDGKRSAQKETYERSTVVAFSLLFILPAVIIVLSLIFMLPLISRVAQQDPSGTTALRPNSGGEDPR